MSAVQWESKNTYLVLTCLLTISHIGNARHQLGTLRYNARKICGYENVYAVQNKTGHFNKYCCKCRDPLIKVGDCKFGLPLSTNCVCPSANNTGFIRPTQGTAAEPVTVPKENSSDLAVNQETEVSEKTEVSPDSDNASNSDPRPPDTNVPGDRNYSEEISPVEDNLMHCESTSTNHNFETMFLASFFGALAALAVWQAAKHFVFRYIITRRNRSEREENSDSKQLINQATDEEQEQSVNFKNEVTEGNRSGGKRKPKSRRRPKTGK